MSLNLTVRKSKIGELCSLLTIDASEQGGSVYRWVNAPIDGSNAVWQGVTYTPYPFKYKKAGISETGIPTTSLNISNIPSDFATIIVNSSTIIGARVSFVETLVRYLDGEPEASFDHIPHQVLYISSISEFTESEITFELVSKIELQDVKLPLQPATKSCFHTYRLWNGVEWINGTCPYVQGSIQVDGIDVVLPIFYKENNPITNKALDCCSRYISGCEARYKHPDLIASTEGVMPFNGFPNIGSVKP